MLESVLICYGAVVVVGGIFGYCKAKSRASLIAGTVSGLFLVSTGLLTVIGMSGAAYVGFVVNLLLVVFFGMRFKKTQAFVPSGMMALISVVVFGWLTLILWF